MWAPKLRIAFRELEEKFGNTVYVTVCVPRPPRGVTCTQFALEVTTQSQVDVAFKVNVPVRPPAGTFPLEGAAGDVHDGVPACVTVKVRPAMVTVPVRVEALAFGWTEMRAGADPAPLP